ncbi:hypothetical protein H5410_040804 [Solanum commersonii]|uniref:Bromo domain-containing protein n=1 Tax=Solanum commersonii TaxID=4109 RepID=A0A9J5XR70_SOLCO|nr:hypothetical protein H5410_040804 [Solanum commersonii]
MVAAEFSNSISNRRRCILHDDESGYIKLMVDKLTRTCGNYQTEQVKLMDTPLQKKSPNIFIQEVEERIKLNEEKGDNKSNEKMDNINQSFIKILDVIIQNKLEQDVYSVLEIANFFRDLLLIFNNAIFYYPNETLQYSVALELRAIILREMGEKHLFCREIVCGLSAASKPMLTKQKMERRAYNARNKALEGESSV